MSAEIPILQAIHKSTATADWRPWYTDEHGAAIRCIGIKSDKTGYRITTYAGGWGFDGYNINIHANGGILSKSSPIRVETGRDYSGLMRLSFDEPQVIEGDLVGVPATASQPPKAEKLLLPGDEGFDLFVDLHEQVRNLVPTITGAVDLIQPGITPTNLLYEYRGQQAESYDSKRKIRSIAGSTLVKVDDTSGKKATIDLDATQEYPHDFSMSIRRGTFNEEVVYRSGIATIESEDGTDLRALDFFVLTAFSAVQSQIEKLYQTS